MSEHARFGTARQVHRSLLRLFIIGWACVALQLHGCLHHEVWPHGPLPRLMAAVPPIVPVVFIVWGKVGPASIAVLGTLITVGLWLVAVRKPAQAFYRIAARFAIILYWLLLWFPMALSS